MKRLRSKKGFTFTEMLCVLVVLTLVSATLVTGIQLGVTYYMEIVTRAEAEVLCSTLCAAVKDELRYTGMVKVRDQGFTYRSQRQGEDTRMSVNADGQVVLINAQGEKPLLSKAAYTHGVRAELDIRFDGQSNVFTVSLWLRSRDGEKVLSEAAFEILRLNTGIDGRMAYGIYAIG